MKRKMFLWLLIGLGCKLQVVASLSITEIVVLVSTPFIFFKDIALMKRDGVLPFFVLSLLVIVGCIIGSIANHTHPEYILRGLATTSILSCSIIFSHWILRRDPGGFKWYILTLPISGVISTFYFKSSVEMTMLGDTSEDIMSGTTYWIKRLNPLVMAPVRGWYLNIPHIYSILAPLCMALFSILTSVSGRSSSLVALACAVMVIIGGKTRRSMLRISRHFWWLCIGGVIFICTAYYLYKTAAQNGLLGADARAKYERQTEGGTGGIGRLILGGRGESFIGLLGCRDNPILGCGPWPQDTKGYTEEFINNYGTYEDIQALMIRKEWEARNGFPSKLLQCHAYITEFWAWYGVLGLLFMLYVIFVLLRYLKQDVVGVPQWFGWLACSVPGMFWSLFFSPFADRFGFAVFIVACLMARAARRGVFRLPPEMIREIEKAEMK